MPERKTPQVRFKGFTDAWEQRKLGEYLEVSTEKNTSDIYGKEDVLSVSGDYGIVNQIEFQGRSFAGASVSNYGVVHIGDIVYTKSPLSSNPYGIIKTNKGKTGIVSTLYAVYHPQENTCADFVQTYFEQHARMNNYMHPLVNKGAKNDMKVSAENALKGIVSFPKLEEQKAISEMFSVVDHIITLHQRECERLQMVKKSMLENCFPKNGEKVPRFRFAGFTGDWEQRKLAELATFTKGAGYSKSDLKESGTPVVLYGRLYTKYETVIHDVDTFVDAKDGSIYSRGGEVVVPASGETAEDIAIASVLEKSGILIGGDLNIIHPCNRLEPVFLAISISNGEPHVDMARRAQGKSVVHLHNEDLSRIELQYPEIEEQQKISQCFLNLDHLITLHQSKLEMLKKIKESMLGKMLV